MKIRVRYEDDDMTCLARHKTKMSLHSACVELEPNKYMHTREMLRAQRCDEVYSVRYFRQVLHAERCALRTDGINGVHPVTCAFLHECS